MGNVTVYLSDELEEQVRKTRIPLSEAAQSGFERALAEQLKPWTGEEELELEMEGHLEVVAWYDEDGDPTSRIGGIEIPGGIHQLSVDDIDSIAFKFSEIQKGVERHNQLVDERENAMSPEEKAMHEEAVALGHERWSEFQQKYVLTK